MRRLILLPSLLEFFLHLIEVFVSAVPRLVVFPLDLLALLIFQWLLLLFLEVPDHLLVFSQCDVVIL